MNFSDERWIKLYTRDTDDWRCLGFEARAVFLHLLRVVDRAGVFETKRGARGVSVAINAPLDVVERAVAELISEGCVQMHTRGFVVPRFVEAQTARQSDRLRAQASRERRREQLDDVTDREASQNVTVGDDTSQDVRSSSRGVTIEKKDQKESKAPCSRPPSALDVRAAELADVAVAEVNRLTGARHLSTTKQTVEDCRVLAKSKYTPDDVRTVVVSKVSEWLKAHNMRHQIKPSVLLRPSNFARYLAELRASSGVSGVAAPAALPLPMNDQIVINGRVLDVPQEAK